MGINNAWADNVSAPLEDFWCQSCRAVVVQQPAHAGTETWWDKRSGWAVPTECPQGTLKSVGDTECPEDLVDQHGSTRARMDSQWRFANSSISSNQSWLVGRLVNSIGERPTSFAY